MSLSFGVLWAWEETHLHVRSVLCHFRPERAYLFFLLFLLSMSSLPIISGKEHRGDNMSLIVSLSGREVAQMTQGEAAWDSAGCVEDEYRALRFPGALRTSAWLWSPAQSHLWCAVYPCVGQEEGGNHIYPTSPGHTCTTEWSPWAQLRRLKKTAAGTQSWCDRSVVTAGKASAKRYWNLAYAWLNAIKEKALAWFSTATFVWFRHRKLKLNRIKAHFPLYKLTGCHPA